MIEAINICKSFGEKQIFHDLSFQIQDGEFVCFSGDSGKGKTTLLNIVGQIEKPTSGTILYNSKEIKTNRERLMFFRSTVGFIFQNFALVEGKTVEQNLSLVRKADREKISFIDVLKGVGIEDKINDKIYTLSGGEQQRVALARLFIKKCSIILADEPTGSLDRHNANRVIDILKRLNSLGKTVILVTHDDSVKQLCNRVIDL